MFARIVSGPFPTTCCQCYWCRALPGSGFTHSQQSREAADGGDADLGAGAIQFFPKRSGIPGCVRGRGDSDQCRQRDKRGNDDPHDGTPLNGRYGQRHCRRSPATRAASTMQRCRMAVVGICQWRFSVTVLGRRPGVSTSSIRNAQTDRAATFVAAECGSLIQTSGARAHPRSRNGASTAPMCGREFPMSQLELLRRWLPTRVTDQPLTLRISRAS